MKYRVQSNSGSLLVPYKEEDWTTVVSFPVGAQEYDDLDSAVHQFNQNVDWGVIWPMRVVDEDGKVYRFYDPARDMRLPGSRHRLIQERAYAEWEYAGKPPGDGQEFWFKAEVEIKRDNGVIYPPFGRDCLPSEWLEKIYQRIW